MTSYVSIPNGDIDQDSPITQPLMTALRDNPIAIAEKDSSVPVGQRLGTWFLGTINTTSGTTQTLSGLDLTEYVYLIFIVNGVSDNGGNTGSRTFTIGNVIVDEITSGSLFVYARMDWDLTTGIGTVLNAASLISSGQSLAPGSSFFWGQTGITTASTSISATVSGASFDAGSIRIYGVK